ncbi:RNA polymerase sigma factor [Nonomuraea sp. NPDC050536]|uniref:RNA polymerase sigma factor n=1 Tax=Nonomuraea sp. NPDC050536 TaxID=3364366 RepID=UPI0037C5F5B1
MADRARERFTRVFADHHRAVLGYLLRRADEHDAQDALSETFLVVWRRLDAVPADDPLPWLIGVARNVLNNQRRSAVRREALRERVMAHAVPAHHDPAPAPDGAVISALRLLGERDREVLMLHAWEDLSAAQIAQVIGGTAAGARLRLHRARRRLVQALEEVTR